MNRFMYLVILKVLYPKATIKVEIYLEFCSFPRFSRFDVQAIDFGLSVECNQIFQIGSGLKTSRLYYEPYWTISDPKVQS